LCERKGNPVGNRWFPFSCSCLRNERTLKLPDSVFPSLKSTGVRSHTSAGTPAIALLAPSAIRRTEKASQWGGAFSISIDGPPAGSHFGKYLSHQNCEDFHARFPRTSALRRRPGYCRVCSHVGGDSVLVVGTIRLVGSNANNVFSQVESSLNQ